MKAIDWIHHIESQGYICKVTNSGGILKVYRPEELIKKRDKAEPFAVLTLWSYPVTWRPQQA